MKIGRLTLFAGIFIMMACNYSTKTKTKALPVQDWALLDFVKIDSVNPVLIPGNLEFIDPITNKQIPWELKDVFNPAIVVRNDTLYMLYRAQDKIGLPGGTSRIGLAYSLDGLRFTKMKRPVLFPDNDEQKKYEWQGGIEDPRIVEDSAGTYYMTYTAYDGTTARLMVATSSDLMNWNKKGPAFLNAYEGKYANKWSKSGSIISKYIQGKIVATKINGKYWMYWGDQNIWTSVSDDLIHWTPVEMEKHEKSSIPLKGQALNMPELKIAIPTRDKMFDADLVEPGPPAMLTDQGILLIYNSRNLKNIGDTSIPDGTYTAGQALLDLQHPNTILKRLDHYFIKPDKPYEFVGQVNNVCFLEGLANFKNNWYLYYGTADSKIAVAIRKNNAGTKLPNHR